MFEILETDYLTVLGQVVTALQTTITSIYTVMCQSSCILNASMAISSVIAWKLFHTCNINDFYSGCELTSEYNKQILIMC